MTWPWSHVSDTLYGRMITRAARLFGLVGADRPTGGTQESQRNLYVIRLDHAVWQVRKFRERNPHYRFRRFRLFRKPCVYVGQTWHDPGVRFQQHKDGYKASRIAKRYGKRLMRKRYEHLNPVLAAEAEDREEDLAVDLRRRGYGVWWN